MENNNYNSNENNYGSIHTDSTGHPAGASSQEPVQGSTQETSSAYGYSYINQEQKNPNNVWRADENTSNSYTGSGTYSNVQQDTGSAYANAQQDKGSGTYGNAQQDAGSSAYANAQQDTGSSAYANTQQDTGSSAYANAQQDAGSAYGGSGAGNAYSNIYGSPNSQGGWNSYKDARKQKKEERARKHAAKHTGTSPNFGIKLAKCASIALIFGLVAGTAFEGSSYVTGYLLGTDSSGTADIAVSGEREILNTAPLASSKTDTDDGLVSAIAEECMPSMVAITNVSQIQRHNFFGQVQNYEVPSAGSGIIVGEDDDNLYIATNNHVVASSTTLTIQFCDGATAAAEIKGTDASADLAVVQVKKTDIEAETLSAIKIATLGDSDAIKLGSRAIAIGNALGYGQSVTGGYISAVGREVTIQDETTGESYTNDLIQTDAAINPGNSGGALLNSSGEVIGINSSKYSDTTVEGIGFAIPSNMARPIIEDLITKEEVTSDKAAFLGVSGETVTASISAAFKMPEGLFIQEVVKGSAAEKYGLKIGDILTKFDGRSIKTMDDLQNRLAYCAAGTEVEITVQRAAESGYEEMTLSVVLGKKNS